MQPRGPWFSFLKLGFLNTMYVINKTKRDSSAGSSSDDENL